MGVHAPGELTLLALLIVTGLIAGTAARWLLRRTGLSNQSEAEAERTTSPRLFYTGLALCSVVGTLALVDGRPLVATVFFAFAMMYAVALVLFLRDQRRAG